MSSETHGHSWCCTSRGVLGSSSSCKGNGGGGGIHRARTNRVGGRRSSRVVTCKFLTKKVSMHDIMWTH